MSLEWPQNTEAQKPVEQTEQVRGEQNLEQELSSEQIEQIMAKVQDIDAKGTAYTTIGGLENSRENFTAALKDGVLGAGINDFGDEKNSRKTWVKRVREKKDKTAFFFNIVGRSAVHDDINDLRELVSNKSEIGRSSYMRGCKDGVTFIIDISKFKEIHPYIGLESTTDLDRTKNRTYRINRNFYYPDEIEEKIDTEKYPHYSKKDDHEELIPEEIYSQLEIHSNYGFMGHHRLPPKFFKGIVLRIRPKHHHELKEELIKYSEELKKKYRGVDLIPNELEASVRFFPPAAKRDYYEFQERLIENKLKETREKNLAVSQVVKDMLECLPNQDLLPVYDDKGDLLWPKQMSYEEVKTFVAERNAKNTNKEEK